MWVVGAAFDSAELVAGQARSAFIARTEIAAGLANSEKMGSGIDL
jgi:hypothetical protein